MFKKRFIELCEQKGVTPTAVCKSIGLSNSAFSAWTDETVPRNGTVKKIAAYFGVAPSYLTDSAQDDSLVLTPHEMRLIRAYRAHPELMSGIDRLLGIDDGGYISLYAAAHSEDNHPDEIIRMSKEQWEKIKNAPETDETLL